MGISGSEFLEVLYRILGGYPLTFRPETQAWNIWNRCSSNKNWFLSHGPWPFFGGGLWGWTSAMDHWLGCNGSMIPLYCIMKMVISMMYNQLNQYEITAVKFLHFWVRSSVWFPMFSQLWTGTLHLILKQKIVEHHTQHPRCESCKTSWSPMKCYSISLSPIKCGWSHLYCPMCKWFTTTLPNLV